jgi:hypothetical protein
MCPWNGSTVQQTFQYRRKPMNVAIYATTSPRTFLAVQVGITPPAQATKLFKHLTLEAGKQRICLDPDEVMAAIRTHGLAVLGVG